MYELHRGILYYFDDPILGKGYQMKNTINLKKAPEDNVNTSKKLLLYKSMWGSEFNKAVLSIRKKIEEKNHNFYQERRQIEFDLLSYTSPTFSSNFRTQVEMELLAHWCKNVLIVLQLAEFLPNSLDQCLKCVTYKNDCLSTSGVGHASEAQYAFTMLMDLDGVQ